MSANTNNTTTSLRNTILAIEVHGHAFEYLYTRITPRCHVLTALATGKAITFRDPSTLWVFFADLIKHLDTKYAPKATPAQQNAIADFLNNSEAYFKQFSQMVNAKVSNYSLNGMQWKLSGYEFAASNAAFRLAQYVSQGI